MMSFALVAPTLLGLGWPLVARWRAEPAQRLLAAVCLSLIAQYLFGWLVYTLDMPVRRCSPWCRSRSPA